MRYPQSGGWVAGCAAALERFPVVPGHPFLRAPGHVLGMPLQLGQIIEGISASKLAGVNQAHEDIAHMGTVRGLEKESGLAV